MSHENPTPLRVGATGTLNGWRVRVAGRLVMSVEVDGETCLWNEFHLVDNSGNSATLVFEEGEAGPEWKLFREFTPAEPLTARETAAKRVGDKVNFDGTPVAITLVDQSRVEFIEGEAPEGVEVGDVAHYFNADTGSRMLVASWTGDEIEFYEGLDAPAESVAAAFGFARGATGGGSAGGASSFRNAEESPASFFGGSATKSSGLLPKIVLVLLGATSLFGAYSCFSRGGANSVASVAGKPAAKISAPASRLANGARGTLGSRTYVVVGQDVVEIARTAGRHDRREYLLREETATPALLINGLSGGAQEWHLLRSVPPTTGLTPYDAAAKRKGETVAVEGRAVRVADLFQSKTAANAPPGANGSPLPSSAIAYGFVARGPDSWLLARWTEQQIQFLTGTVVTEADVLAAFGPAATKTK